MMAMNKKERAEMDRLRDDLALSRSLRWPDYPRPKKVSLEWIKANLVSGGIKYGHPQEVARGWFYNANIGSYSQYTVTYGCSDGIYHNRDGDTPSSQNIGRMYATRLEALQALRIDLTEQCARILADVDKQIAEQLGVEPAELGGE
jgi:hypothetical protein